MRRDLAILALAKIVVGALVLLVGFRAVSDDDYARVVIAQEWARAPKLDPSGTSWLPLPFWILGAAMRIFGRSLLVAQIFAVVMGVVATWTVYVAARWITGDRTSALLGALVACATSWSAMLGVSTVPELWTAALCLLAIGAVARPLAPPSRAAIGGAALLAASLCRYEPWFVAAPFALFVARDVVRSKEGRAARVLGAALAIAGPVAWIAWNRAAHGAPLHFLSSVGAYTDAAGISLGRRLVTYAWAMLRAEPELFALGGLVLACVPIAARRRAIAPLRRPAIACAFLFVALTASGLFGGGPTHHPERALVLVFLVAALALGRLVVEAARAPETFARTRALFGVVIVAGLSFPARALVLRNEVLAQRDLELDIGARAAARLAPGTKVHLDVVDYGYFAVQAGSGRPEDFIPNEERGLGAVGLPAMAPDGLSAAMASGLGYAVLRARAAPGDAILLENSGWALVEMARSVEPR